MAQTENAFETYAATSKAMFEFWISHFPTAPMFGVEWRYGEMMVPAEYSKTVEPEVEETAEVIEFAASPEEEVAPAAESVEVEAAAEEPEAKSVEPEAEPEVVKEDVAEVVAADEITPPMLYSEPPAKIDDLTAIKGVGPGLQTQMNDLGIYTFEQLASFDDDQMTWLDENLRTLKGRCIRDDWSGQARSLLG